MGKTNHVHNRRDMKQKKQSTKQGVIVDKSVDSELKREVEAFLTNGKPDALFKLATNLENLNLPRHNIKYIVKEAIKDNIKKYSPEADEYGVYVKNRLSSALASIDVGNFSNRQWQYVPFILKNEDYQKILLEKKYPIYIEKYDYDEPIYKFKNSIKFKNEMSTKFKKIKSSNDLQFFIGKDEQTLFAKVIYQRFTPISFKLISKAKKNLSSEENKADLIYRPDLYEHSLSISSYVLLDGDPKKAHMYMRYDGGEHLHKNLFLGNDKREAIFGAEAKSPHFHFQNEDDNLICIKKFRDSNRHVRFKTGRCNAIDCEHLVNYLVKLENTSNEEIEKQFYSNQHYNMPFLEAMYKHKSFAPSTIENLLDNYGKDKDVKEQEYLKYLYENFKPKQSINCHKFKKLVDSLEFLQYIHNQKASTQNLSNLKALTEIEILCADDVVNSISNSKEKFLESNYQMKYSINGSYLANDIAMNGTTEVSEDSVDINLDSTYLADLPFQEDGDEIMSDIFEQENE